MEYRSPIFSASYFIHINPVNLWDFPFSPFQAQAGSDGPLVAMKPALGNSSSLCHSIQEFEGLCPEVNRRSLQRDLKAMVDMGADVQASCHQQTGL
jgi:hypothetical protein